MMRRVAVVVALALVGCPPPPAPVTPDRVEAPDPAPVMTARRATRPPSKPLLTPEQKKAAADWVKRKAQEEAERRAGDALVDFLLDDD